MLTWLQSDKNSQNVGFNSNKEICNQYAKHVPSHQQFCNFLSYLGYRMFCFIFSREWTSMNASVTGLVITEEQDLDLLHSQNRLAMKVTLTSIKINLTFNFICQFPFMAFGKEGQRVYFTMMMIIVMHADPTVIRYIHSQNISI